MKPLAGWGGHPVVLADEWLSEDLEAITRDAVVSRGLGRSYGDASLPPEGRPAACTRLADRILGFDAGTGALRAEAGLSLDRLNAIFLPRGWFVPVTPGTQFVTLGGMVAADVHGKNHHVAGCFGEHVRSLRMRLADGRIADVHAQAEPELFRATLGGMGLTGHVLEVEFRLERVPSPWIVEETERAADLDESIGKLRAASAAWPFTVTWVDALARGRALGRGIVIKGRWATPDEAPRSVPRPPRSIGVPCNMPGWLLNRWGGLAFNALYYRRAGRRPRRRVVSPYPFFYPLDVLRSWNLLYGRAGFTQYQCVIPHAAEAAVHRRFFEAVARSGEPGFLCVVKDCGAEGTGLLSFPMPGISIALDLPMRGSRTQTLVDALNEVVIAAGGRVYLAKDALTRPEHFRAMESRLDAWQAVRRRWDPSGRLETLQALRLFGVRG